MTSKQEFCPDSADERLMAFSAESLVTIAAKQTQFQQLSPAALAYVGDAVYELFMRTHYLFPPKRLELYHRQVVGQVRAESQAACLQTLQPYLTEAEAEIVRRGRNAAKRSKRVDPDIYQQATGLEALFGYLYLVNPQRLMQLFNQLQSVLDHSF